MKTRKLTGITITMGADPEFFFINKKTGAVIGAERVLPHAGIPGGYMTRGWNGEPDTFVPLYDNKVIIDGVQAELNVAPQTCRQSLASMFKYCFFAIDNHLKETKGLSDVALSFDPLVEVSAKEMKKLSDKSKEFGCAPSFNIHGEAPIDEDPKKYTKRGAGGHLHFGGGGLTRATLQNAQLTVTLLDIIVGNTCVLLDRHPGNAERRKTYGRAGEYRLPPHGLEYRTLSNFWLKNYVLMSMVFALARQALSYALDVNKTMREELLASVDMQDIVTAINTNDAKLALKNFQKYGPILARRGNAWQAVNDGNYLNFCYFVKVGYARFLKKDPMTHWLTDSFASGRGWESFIGSATTGVVQSARRTAEARRKVVTSVKLTVRKVTNRRKPIASKLVKELAKA